MNTLCERCGQGPEGETGHGALEFYVGGPYPGHHIYNCQGCGERWIRHRGLVEKYAWTRYAVQFPIRRPLGPETTFRAVPC